MLHNKKLFVKAYIFYICFVGEGRGEEWGEKERKYGSFLVALTDITVLPVLNFFKNNFFIHENFVHVHKERCSHLLHSPSMLSVTL